MLHVEDGNDLEAIDRALTDAASQTDRPTLIRLRTIIGYPAPTGQGTAKAHGEALGDEEVRKTKEILAGRPNRRFTFRREPMPSDGASWPGGELRDASGSERLAAYRTDHAGACSGIRRRFGRRLSVNWDERTSRRSPPVTGLATRQASGAALQALVTAVPDAGRRLRRPGGKHRHRSQGSDSLRPGEAGP